MDRRLNQSRRQEARIAKEVGGRTTSGSGNQWHTKNDVRTEDESFELKTTDKSQYILKVKDLKEAERNALLDNREMVFGIEFALDGVEVMVITRDYYLDLRERSWS